MSEIEGGDLGIAKLPEGTRERVFAWLQERGGGMPACPICGRSDWIVADYETKLLLVDPEAGADLHLGYPAIAVMSGYCGYMILLNSIIVGVQTEKLGG